MRLARLALVGLLLALGSARMAAAAAGSTACRDKPAPGAWSCKQQRAWGKCEDKWLVAGGWCVATCGRCGQAPAAANIQADAPTPAAASARAAASKPAINAPKPAANASTTTPSKLLSGNVGEYGKVLGMSWLFIYAQRSGKLSAANNPIDWRGDSHLADRVPGGFYDAGDHLKLNFPLATSLSFLAWGVLEFPATYAATGQTK
ncbi:hypothetical protein CHLNCDRAFT_139590, partial [Chlorella variabilis]